MSINEAVPTPYAKVCGTMLQPNNAQAMAEAQYRGPVKHYLAERAFDGDQTPERTAVFFGIGRYATLLAAGMEALQNKFSGEEVLDMLNVYGQTVFDLASLKWLADDYCDGATDDLSHASTETLRIARTLRSLSLLERCALVDVLERIWFVEGARHPEWSMQEIADAVGLMLRD